jgi:phage shock protein PspC (stress-responsive transcriptional regulator)
VFYWYYKYIEGFAKYVKKDNKTILWFILFILFGFIMPGMVQYHLNKLA